MAIKLFKQGDSFDLVNLEPYQYRTDDGSLSSDFTGWTARSQVRHRGVLLTELDFEWIDAATCRFRLSSDADLYTWPLDELRFDVQFTAPDGTTRMTKTVIFELEHGVTQPVEP